MYGNHIRVGFYWGGRGQSLGDCARRTAGFLSGLATHLDSLGTWFDVGDRGHGDGGAVTPSPDGLGPLLAAGAALDDLGGPMPTLGFTLSLGNRPGGDYVHLKLISGWSSPLVQ